MSVWIVFYHYDDDKPGEIMTIKASRKAAWSWIKDHCRITGDDSTLYTIQRWQVGEE